MSEAGTVVCDLDGVVYLEGNPIPRSGEALFRLEEGGFQVLFATNNSSRTTSQVTARITRLSGYQAAEDQVLGAAEAAARLLRDQRPRTLVVGGAGIAEALARNGIPEAHQWGDAGAVVLGLSMDLGYQQLKEATLAIRNGARFIATNSDLTFPTPEGQVPGAGALVRAVEAASGVVAEIAGKPHPPMRLLIKERLGPGPVWVVGDRAETDLAMAHAEGWTPVLVLGGVTARAEDVPETLSPELVVVSLVELAERLGV